MKRRDDFFSGEWKPLDVDARVVCVQLAQGEPGDCVQPGLFPDERCKRARLALAADGYWQPSTLMAIAMQCDGPLRSHFKRSYHAHDAFACALVHPRIAATDKVLLLNTILSPSRSYNVGWRSKRKSLRIARWAVATGYVDPSLLPPVLRQTLCPGRSRGA